MLIEHLKIYVTLWDKFNYMICIYEIFWLKDFINILFNMFHQNLIKILRNNFNENRWGYGYAG
ncbi:hypothetical protein JCM16138_23030 [Thermococcus atlanticus]